MGGHDLDPSDHTKKDVKDVLKLLVAAGWTIKAAGHWGTLQCPCDETCLTIPVPGSPKSPSTAARRIMQAARRCPLPEDDPRRTVRPVVN